MNTQDKRNLAAALAVTGGVFLAFGALATWSYRQDIEKQVGLIPP